MPQTPILHALSVAIGADTAPDAELLRRFVEGNDRTAFELVVRRHAELVWSVCRATLPHDLHAAEDAFQATFLALARRAASVHDSSAAGWLFRVARNAAGRASARGARRGTVPLPDLLTADAPSVDEGASVRERAPLVIEEVDRLVASLREPVVLCFFEGCTHAEAAARLGWPVGTVASRLARAKDLLRARLVRRGVALPATGPVAVLMMNGANAAPVRHVLAIVGAPAGGIPPGVLSLTQGVLSTMRIAQLKTAVAVAVLAVGLVAAAVAAALRTTSTVPVTDRAAPTRPTAPRAPHKGEPDPKEREAKERKALKGEWRAVEIEANGMKLSEVGRAAMVATVRATFSDNDFRFSMMGNNGDFKLALAPAESPHRIDLTVQGGGENPDAGKVVHGIYERTDDTLKFSFDPKNPPTKFKTGEGQSFFIMERIKDEKEELKALAGEWKNAKVNTVEQVYAGTQDFEITLNIEQAGARIKSGDIEEALAIRVDPSAAPPTIDLVATDGKENGTKLAGVYFRQKDKLMVCFAAEKDAPRPTELKSGGDGQFLLVLERTPKK